MLFEDLDMERDSSVVSVPLWPYDDLEMIGLHGGAGDLRERSDVGRIFFKGKKAS